MSDTMEHISLTIAVNREQRDALDIFFSMNNWRLNVLSENSIIEDTTKDTCTCTLHNEKVKVEYKSSTSGQQPNPGEPEPGDDIDNDVECLFCLCTPCCTSRPQLWLGCGQPARAGNTGVRKTMCKKYWGVLNFLGTWSDMRYLEQKAQAMGRGDNPEDVWIAKGKIREIMPLCVLKQVRGLYPNPEGIPYMGHKWQ